MAAGHVSAALYLVNKLHEIYSINMKLVDLRLQLNNPEINVR